MPTCIHTHSRPLHRGGNGAQYVAAGPPSAAWPSPEGRGKGSLQVPVSLRLTQLKAFKAPL